MATIIATITCFIATTYMYEYIVSVNKYANMAFVEGGTSDDIESASVSAEKAKRNMLLYSAVSLLLLFI